MKLIKQTQLIFQQGTSDKVYEIDLCEVGQNLYVVNFRYGRRGTNLKEGAKTTNAVPLVEAENIFDSLVAEKTKKGYRDAANQAASLWGAQKAAASVAPFNADARKQAVLNHLADAVGANRQDKKVWKLERVIWRAGELKIKEAAPLLMNLLGSKDALRDYCICWALGFCGDEQNIPVLSKLYQNRSTADMVRRMACEALLKLSNQETKAQFQDNLLNTLPQELSYLARQGSAEEFSKALTDYLQTGDHTRYAVFETLYLIDNENTRPALLDRLGKAPLKPNFFKALRHLFKAAEYRRDAEVFGLIAYRFEKSRANFSTWEGLDKTSRYAQWVYLNSGNTENQTLHIQNGREEIQSPTSRLAYSTRTRIFLRKRVWRTLRRLAELGDIDYVKMAVGVLLPFSDADAQQPKQSSLYSWSTNATQNIYWGAYAGYWAFNHILYSNSPRYFLKRNSKGWRYKSAYKPGDAAPDVREEAFPNMWEQKPEGLLHLLAESACQPVLEFAVKALNDCAEFCSQLDVDTLIMILERPYELTARLGFKLAKERYHALSPNRNLTLALANCAFDEARREAQRWIQATPGHFLNDTSFVTALVFSAHADTREFARQWLSSSAFSETAARELAAKLMAQLMTLEQSQADLAGDVARIIEKSFAEHLRSCSLNLILELLAHPLLAAQELGGNLLLQHNTQAKDLPEAIIHSLIASPYESLRGIGIKLFGLIDEETLLGRHNVIAAFAMHELEDIRQAIRPVIHRLCFPPVQPDQRNEITPLPPIVDPLTSEQRQEFSLKIAEHFLKALFEKELHEGVHSSLVKIMREDVGVHWMKQATQGKAWKLIHTKSPAAQELGGILLEFKTSNDSSFTENFDFSDLVELTNHEVLAVRQASWVMFSKMLYRLHPTLNANHHLQEMAKAVKLLEADWDDSRSFWLSIFDVHFTANHFTPGILVSICDSVHTDVQAFGRKLITRYFAEADGQEYLLKLSEHPSADLQTFATNYLERYAADNPARLKELQYYFVSVLSRVNKARVAKNRVIAFLTAEAQKDVAAAQFVADIFARQSLTMALGDKAAAIEAMLKIHQTFPQIPLPIQIKATEARNAF
jgi:predicted DNA-binding WGR domain protein